MIEAIRLNRRLAFAVAVVLQFVILSLMIADKYYTLVSGTKVMLETVSRDPTSLFSGDYLKLIYKISTIPLSEVATDLDTSFAELVPNAMNTKEFKRFYVTLRENRDTGFWEAVSVTRRKPSLHREGEVAIGASGRLHQYRGYQNDWISYLDVNYGLETYYVQEGTGAALESAMQEPGAAARVEVSVDRRGKSAIVAIH